MRRDWVASPQNIQITASAASLKTIGLSAQSSEVSVMISYERFSLVHKLTAHFEGGWSNHKADPGGKTMYGVTERVFHAWLRSKGKTLRPVRTIKKDEALQIYYENYWLPTAGKYNLYKGVDRAVYDAAVNSGVGRARKWLIKASGSNDHSVTAAKICDLRLNFMMSLRIWKTFGRGWSRRVAAIRAKSVEEAIAAMNAEKSRPIKIDPVIVANNARKQAEKQAQSADKGQKVSGGVVGTSGASGGALAVQDAVTTDLWLGGAILTAFIVSSAALLWYSKRKEVRKEEAIAFSEGNYPLDVCVTATDA